MPVPTCSLQLPRAWSHQVHYNVCCQRQSFLITIIRLITPVYAKWTLLCCAKLKRCTRSNGRVVSDVANDYALGLDALLVYFSRCYVRDWWWRRGLACNSYGVLTSPPAHLPNGKMVTPATCACSLHTCNDTFAKQQRSQSVHDLVEIGSCAFPATAVPDAPPKLQQQKPLKQQT